MLATLRRLWVCALVFLSLQAGVSDVLAADTRVLLLRPASPSAILSEALVYVQGELSSVDLETSQAVFQTRQRAAAPVLRPGTYGALVFVEQGGVLTIEAYRPDVPEPISQQLDTRDGRITPQVVAIRAVEALRAAMQQLVRSHPDEQDSVPEEVQRFARVDKTHAATPSPQLPPEPPQEPEPPTDTLQVGVWAAPEVRLDPQADHPFFGFATSIVIGKSWIFAVAHFDTTVTPLEFEADSGRAEVGRFSASGQLRFRAAFTANLGGYLQAGAGVALFDVKGFAAPNYDAERERHTTAIGVGGIGIDYWAMRHLGFFVELAGSAALNSPAVGLARDERRRLERPLVGASVGLAISYR